MITSDSRHFTASAAVIDPKAGKALLVAHHANGTWQFPGGHVDDNEEPSAAALREVLEETGVTGTLVFTGPDRLAIGTLLLPQPILVGERPAPAKPALGEPAHRHIDFLYLVIADSTAPVTHQADENSGAAWFDYAEIRSVNGVREDVPAQLTAALAADSARQAAEAERLARNPLTWRPAEDDLQVADSVRLVPAGADAAWYTLTYFPRRSWDLSLLAGLPEDPEPIVLAEFGRFPSEDAAKETATRYDATAARIDLDTAELPLELSGGQR